MGIAVPDSAIPPVDEELSALVAGNLARSFDSLLLGPVNGRGALATRASYSPSAVMGNDVLITFTHNNLLILKDFACAEQS